MRTVAGILLLSLLLASSTPAIEPAGFEAALGFESSGEELPPLWQGGPPETLFLDRDIVHSGEAAGRIERDAQSPGDFSTFTSRFDIDFEGEFVELRGWLRSEDVEDFFGLWARVDGASGPIVFDNMQKRQLRGTRDWTEFSIELPLLPQGEEIYFGALMSGNGTLWVDDLSWEVDGVPLADVPRVEPTSTALDEDKEFLYGSRVEVLSVSEVQTENLTLLGRVWGYLKYHHPRVTAGEYHWDFELFRVMPRLLEAKDGASARSVLVEWIDGLGSIDPCDPCIESLESEAAMEAPTRWIGDSTLLGDALSEQLVNIHAQRPAGAEQFFVGLNHGVSNPRFDHEPPYEQLDWVDTGYRLLALFRFWNIIEYWFPYRDLLEDHWPSVLADFVPRLVAAEEESDYARQLLALVARSYDGHCNLWSGLVHRPPIGDCRLPVKLREVEGKFMVVEFTGDDAMTSPLREGDLLLAIDGKGLDEVYDEVETYYANSNRPHRRHHFARQAARGDCGPCEVLVQRDEMEPQILEAERIETNDRGGLNTHDRPGEAFQMLDNIAYLKLSQVVAVDLHQQIDRAREAEGLVIDIRNYPSEFVVFALGQYLVQETTPFARFTRATLDHPGRFEMGPPVSLVPHAQPYDKPVVVLVDETSMSQSEYTALAFGASPRVRILGSTTAGADGNISTFGLPGGHKTMISGIGVFGADGTPTQRVGIVPDQAVRPTIGGMREGRDEVLEAAVEDIRRRAGR